MASEERLKALDAALAQIEKQYGKGSVMKLGDKSANMNIEVVPTGSLSLDLALGLGGMPKGRIIEVYGPESSGKTTVAFNIGGILAEESKVLFIDMDPQSNLSDNVGIDTTDQSGATVRDVFNDPMHTKAEEVITKSPMWQYPNLDIVASHIGGGGV